MKGGEITLDNIDSTIKENLNPTPQIPESRTRQILLTPFRIIGQVIEGIGSALGPLGRFIFSVIRVFIGLIVFFVGLGLTIAPIIALAVYLGVLTNDEYRVLMDNFPIELFSNMVPIWLVIAASSLLIIPGIIIILLGLSVIAAKNLVNGRLGLVALGLWLLCVGISAFQIPRIVALFKSENWHNVETAVPVTPGTLILRLNPVGEESTFNEVNLKLEGTADSIVSLREEYFSRGKTKAEAMERAQKIGYNYVVSDSVITFDEGYDLATIESFRDQKLNLILEIPYDRPFIMERSLLEILNNTLYRNGYRNSDVSESNVWTFNEAGLVCLTCRNDESNENTEEEAEELIESDTTEISKETIDSLTRAKFREAYFMKD